MPLIIHDPMHDLPPEIDTLSGSLDLAPTLLHLLGVNVGMHSMTGKSIFGSRRQTPWLLGRVGGRLVYANNQHSQHEATRSTLQTICEQGSKLVPKGEDWVTACDVLDWLRWQDALWSNRRLYPTGIYHGQLGR